VGQIRTSSALGQLRGLVPAYRRGCGFWPNCTATRTVLPRPCWDQLSLDASHAFSAMATSEAIASACGSEEPALLNAAQRLEGGEVRSERSEGPERVSERGKGREEPHAPSTLVGVGPKVGLLILGPDGPQPLSQMDGFPRFALCLASWQGEASDGASVVFTRCPEPGPAPEGARPISSAAANVRIREVPRPQPRPQPRPKPPPQDSKGRRLQHGSHSPRRREDAVHDAKLGGDYNTADLAHRSSTDTGDAAPEGEPHVHFEAKRAEHAPRQPRARRARAMRAEEWVAVSVEPVAEELMGEAARGISSTNRGRSRMSRGSGVRLSPANAQHLCLTAPPMAMLATR